MELENTKDITMDKTIKTFNNIIDKHSIKTAGGWSDSPNFCYMEGALDMYNAICNELGCKGENINISDILKCS